MSKKLLAQSKQFRLTGLIAVVAALAVVGAYFILHIHAATCSSPPGDANCDTVVNVLDLSILATNWGKTSATWSMGDFNGDTVVNIIDLSIMASHWGSGGGGNPPGAYVSGNRLVDGSGNTLLLHGVNVPSALWACAQNLGIFQEPTDQTAVNALLSWHINAVRVAVNEDCWLGINGVPAQYAGQNYINGIVNYINLLNQNGIYAILDLQAVAPGTNLAAAIGAPQSPMPDQDHAPAFWSSAAATFKNNRGVLFDLYNEPWPDNNSDTTAAWTCWKNGGTCSGVTYNGASYQAAGMQELVSTIRTAGANNVLMLGGTNFAYKFDQWLSMEPTDPAGQLAASFHTYFGACPLNNNNPSQVSPDTCYGNFKATVGAQVPIITGELGEGDCASGMVTPYMNWADANGVSYLGWGWDPFDCNNFPSLITNYNGTPTNFGLGFQQHYQSVFPTTPPLH